MSVVLPLLYLFIYPGLIFLFVYSLFVEWVDRKVYARLQNRIGPLYTGKNGLLQPLADLIKLMVKEELIPRNANHFMYTALPVIGLALVATAGLYLPLWHFSTAPSYTSFPGDLVVVMYLLGLPTFIFFLAGWMSSNTFGEIGGVRVLTMLFGYEVPFLMAILSPAVLAGSWRLSEIAAFYQAHPGFLPINIIAFLVALISFQAKLERIPFDIPHAETELAGGTFADYSGRSLAYFRLMTNFEMVVGSGVMATVFFAGFPGGALLGGIQFIVKTLIIIFLLSVMRASFARLRLDQMVAFAWVFLAPLAVIQLLIVILVKGLMMGGATI